MPSYDELEQEAWWNNEFEPPNLRKLTDALRTFYRVGPNLIGAKGDNNHTRGYHRSRHWILNSAYCTNRTYSVSRTPGDRSGGDGNWICAVDISVPHDVLLPMCQRLDSAVRSGRLEKVTEWYGNTDGDSRVDGYDNIANRLASSDSSHLWHLHFSLDRGHANDDHTDLFEILTGSSRSRKVFTLVRSKTDPEVFLADGLTRRWLETDQDIEDVKYLARTGQIAPLYKEGEVQFVDNLDAYGSEVANVEAPEVDLDELAGKVAARLTELRFTAQN